jgi:hypothetical protein
LTTASPRVARWFSIAAMPASSCCCCCDDDMGDEHIKSALQNVEDSRQCWRSGVNANGASSRD